RRSRGKLCWDVGTIRCDLPLILPTGLMRCFRQWNSGVIKEQVMATTATFGKIETYLGAKTDSLLGFKSPKIAKERLHLPGLDFIDRSYAATDRNLRVLANLQRMFGGGRLSRTGYLSILPVDQGIEHSGGASFAKNPDYFDGENIVKLAIEGGCNAVASTF